MVFAALNDRDIIKRQQVEGIVRNVSVSYAHLRRSFQVQLPNMQQRLKEGDVTGTVKLAREAYGLPRHLLQRVGYSASINVPAAIQLSFELFSNKLHHTTLLFRQTEKQLCQLPEYRLIHFIAHELAHARMFLDAHMLMQSEFATDVLAVLIAGDRVSYERDILSDKWQHGYLRDELLGEVFRCLARYSDIIYLK